MKKDNVIDLTTRERLAECEKRLDDLYEGLAILATTIEKICYVVTSTNERRLTETYDEVIKELIAIGAEHEHKAAVDIDSNDFGC
jgi:hypothetical protein